MAPARPRVQSLDRALDLLEALGAADELGVSEVAGRTGLVPSTAHRLLTTLVERRYVTQTERGRYQLGPMFLELASGREDPSVRLRAVARPHLRAIQHATGDTANLVVLEGRDVVYLDQIEGSRTMRMFTEVGSTALAHSTGAGKAILAWLPPDDVHSLYGPPTEPLEQLTVRTLGTVAELDEELARIRRRGYAIDDEEHEEGVSCVAAAVFDGSGTPRGAISVSGPSPRILNANTTDLATLIHEHAARASRALGYESSD
jgi:DNA-binding IclR family transcriptional regulator